MTRATAPLVTVLLLVVAGCGFSDLAFRQDQRLRFVTPYDRAEVTLPVTVRWTVEDFEVGPGAGSFAVFVNRAPPPPGQPLEWLARDDAACRRLAGCPDERWFAERHVYRTTDLELTLYQLPRGDDRRELHEITVVLLDERGRRIGETGWTLELQLMRD